MKNVIIGGLFFIGGIMQIGIAVLGRGDGSVFGFSGIIFGLFGACMLFYELIKEKKWFKEFNENINKPTDGTENNDKP
jgi:membrane associated rhomboid family serine protease